MEVATLKAFKVDTIDKALIRSEWEKWIRSLKLYLDSEDIVNPLKRQNMLLHYGRSQLQEVAYNLPFQTTIGILEKPEIVCTFYVILDGNVIRKDTAQRLRVLKLGIEVNSIIQATSFPKIKKLL